MASNPLKDKGFNPEDMSKENYDRIDLHRPYVDEIFLVSESGKKMVRESDLIDVWFDSGAMPYAQEGLRNLGSKYFGCTADFIAEGVDQTRGWFYTLHAINTMVSGKCAFKRVISNGLVLDKNGDKMSKRKGNAVDPFKALDDYGADALRWYMLTNAQPWDNLRFDAAGVDEVRRKFFGTLYNTYSFFALYANVDNFDPQAPAVPLSERPELDRWILSMLNSLVKDVEAAYEDYDVTQAGRLIQEFVCDHLSNWYVRLGRKRFWGGGMSQDKLSAYQTLHEVLLKVSILAAPIAPFYMDRLYLDLTGSDADSEFRSVHFVAMPVWNEAAVDKDLEERMELAQKASSMVLALRRKVNIKVRQPLSKIVIPVISDKVKEQLEKVKTLLLGEVNVKDAEFIHDTVGLITKKIKPNFKTLGKLYGKQMKEIAAAFTKLSQEEIVAIEASDSYTLALPSGDVVLSKGDYEVTSEDMPGWLVANDGQLTLALDVTVTDDLRREGVARELINRIQNLRKESGFEVTDRITVTIDPVTGEYRREIEDTLKSFDKYIASQTLALEIVLGDASGGSKVEWAEGSIRICVRKQG